MTEDLKPTGAEEPKIVRKPVILPLETETNDDDTRSVTKDRLPGERVTDKPERERASVIRKPIVLPVETKPDGDSRSVTKDRLPGGMASSESTESPPRVRKPIVVEPPPED